MTDDVDEIMSWDPPRTVPRVAAFQGADGGQTDYFIFIEKAVLCKVNTFAKAIPHIGKIWRELNLAKWRKKGCILILAKLRNHFHAVTYRSTFSAWRTLARQN